MGNMDGMTMYHCSAAVWFVSCDIQLYVVSFITLILFYRKPSWGIALAVFKIILGMAIVASVIYVHDISPVIFFIHANFEKSRGFLTHLYVQAYNYLPSYEIGLILGYILVKKYKLPVTLRPLSWVIFAVLLIGPSALLVSLYDGVNFTGSRILEIALGSSYRTLIGIGFAGLMYMCWLEPQSWFSRLLGARILTPLAKMSFSVYMTHIIIVTYMHGVQREMFSMTMWAFTEKVAFLLITSFLVGYVTYICVEAPFKNMVKAFTSPEKREVNNNKKET
jgi:peptidoglycan/LPS O-acetylase OafA/YrhL